MLNDAWQILRASFNKRLCLYYAVVTCFTMFGSIPIMPFKLVFLAALVPIASLFLMILGRNFLYPTFKFIWLSGKAPRLPVPNQLKQLAKRMNTPLEEIKIINIKEKNAFATRKGIVFTRGLLDALDKGEIMSVAAHELAHIKGKHVTYKFIATMGVMTAIMVEWLRFTYPILLNETITQVVLQTTLDIAMLAFLFVAMIPMNWIAELKADKAAVKFEGKENMQSALLKLTKPEEQDQPSETHPSTKQRIKHIEEMKT